MSLSRLLVVSDNSSNIKAFKDVEYYAGTTISSGDLFSRYNDRRSEKMQDSEKIRHFVYFIYYSITISVLYSILIIPTN